ncbi:hypothetical protein C0Q70_14438 [Pomacea canaliculata]|uniref:NAD-dependent protein deacetylase n=4 Tax=Pomacea canaliculata TaxID=400727 RepID=A0A2T7P011_POMCA|nr:hypothetical protein C0Q70_14438 [Pomacea canaliculata]
MSTDNDKAIEEGSEGESEAASNSQTPSTMESLSRYLLDALSLAEDTTQILEEVSFEGVAKYITSGKCQNIITMVGAGISTSAGIPDFRSPGTGLYDNLQQYNLPHPQAIFMIDFFKENPKPFFVLAKELYPGSFKPTPCHYFIKMLNDKGLLLRHYTQNIDTLERVSGLPEDKIVEAHGTFHTSHCMECGKVYSLSWMKEKIFADEIPHCEEADCGGVIKPDIVFFGESLPQRFAECASLDFKKCDLLIILGTSLVVQPFASLAHRVSASTPRLYINLEKCDSSDMLMAMLFGGGFTFDAENNTRDVFKKAMCDEGCYELAQLLGWGDELQSLVKKEHERIDQLKTASMSGDGSLSDSSVVATRQRDVQQGTGASVSTTETHQGTEKSVDSNASPRQTETVIKES